MDDTYTQIDVPEGMVNVEHFMEDQLPISPWMAPVQCHLPNWACDEKETRSRFGRFNESYDLDNCGRGSQQLYHAFPALDGTVYFSDWEKDFNARWPFCFARNNIHVAVLFCVGYVVFVFGGMELMKRYKPFDLNTCVVAGDRVVTGPS
jgi:hypothetical protein